MAARLQLSRPKDGMNFIWNVSQLVGDHVSCANMETDVELVSIMIAETIKLNRPNWLHTSIRQALLMDGGMNVNTGYWIRVFNGRHSPRLEWREEGKISPAQGGDWGGRDTWTIVRLNGYLHTANPNLWENLPTHPNASAALRRELQQ